MPPLNWGMIQDGGMFESLVHAILWREDPGVVLLGRPGKDSGQDARSGDRETVFQVKYRQGMTMNAAAKLALDELRKIVEYQTPTHGNFKHWQGIRRWVLVGNFLLNPNDESEWLSKVVPEFQRHGLKVDFWDRALLEQKLIEHPEVGEVFFGGENRVLVGLKEARDLFVGNAIGAFSLDKPMVDREAEMKVIRSFADDPSKRVLPVVGPGGIGKTRLLYESLVLLGDDGWRVFWALPEAMARSSRWFHLLNGIQRTCVAIDDPEDLNLLKAVVEQLATPERRNWKVIVACRSERSDMLDRFRTSQHVSRAMVLRPLGDVLSRELVRSHMTRVPKESFLYDIFKYTKGVPVWLCLIAELAERGALDKWPETADQIASSYVAGCIDRLSPNRREVGRRILQWLSLWSSFAMEVDDQDSDQLKFLIAEGIEKGTVREVLSAFVSMGMVENWGFRKRAYAIRPLVIREHILASWLFDEAGGTCEVNSEGRRIVSHLVLGELPEPDLVLRSLLHLTQSRLETSRGYSFLKPVFDAMFETSKKGNAADQQRQLDLVEKIGAADPESALKVLKAIRETDKADMELEVPLWGRLPIRYKDIVGKIPSVLSHLARSVTDQTVARRYLEEFRQLIRIGSAAPPMAGGRRIDAEDELGKLLRGSKNADAFTMPASEIVRAELDNEGSWPFVGILLECLTDPERDCTEWVSDWTLSFGKRPVAPGSSEWDLAADMRGLILDRLRESTDVSLRCRLWASLAESHDQYHRMILHGNVGGGAANAYRSVLVEDLKACQSILSHPPTGLTIEEVTNARKVWDWHLEYDKDEEIIAIARQSEEIHDGVSALRLHDFFRFATREELLPESRRIAALLSSFESPSAFEAFFEDALRYLRAARAGGLDGADFDRMYEVAAAMVHLFSPGKRTNALTSFVESVLGRFNGEEERQLEYRFAIRICQLYLKDLKGRLGEEALIARELDGLLGLASSKGAFIYSFYAYAHPFYLGSLTETELSHIQRHSNEFRDSCQLFATLGGFAPVNWDVVKACLDVHMASPDGHSGTTSRQLEFFVDALHVSVLRYRWPSEPEIVRWVIDSIIERKLDGKLLELHGMEALREWAGFRLKVIEFVRLLRSRVVLESKSHPEPSFRLMPYEFKASAWCSFDKGSQEERHAFRELCGMVLVPGFMASYWLPRYIAELDSTGDEVARFVHTWLRSGGASNTRNLSRVSSLASAYSSSSEAWAAIARPICERARLLDRDERDEVYFSLSRKGMDVWSCKPGEVPEVFRQNVEVARQLLGVEPIDTPLRGFREWSLRVAEADLDRETARVEADAHG